MLRQKEFVVKSSIFSHQTVSATRGPQLPALERMSARVNREGESKDGRVTYQGIRHLNPANISPLRSIIEQSFSTGGLSSHGQAEQPLHTLQQVNRQSPIEPPMIHRPFSRYVSSVLVEE